MGEDLISSILVLRSYQLADLGSKVVIGYNFFEIASTFGETKMLSPNMN
jgi:hypothetical protein